MKGGINSGSRRSFILRLTGFLVLSAAAVCWLTLVLLGSDDIIAQAGIFCIILLAGSVILSVGEYRHSADEAEISRSHESEGFRYAQILTLVNNLADAILSVNEKGTIKLYNAAALNLLDTNVQLNDRALSEVLPLKDSDGNNVDLATIIASAHSVTTRDDLIYALSDDESIRLEVTFSPIRSSVHRTTGSEDDNGSIVILRDVTKAKSLEEERDEFISVVSHELRTPITIAEGTISNLELMNERGILTQEKSTEAIKNAHEQILFLASMVNDLSTLSRAERGVADNPESIDVRTMINDLYNEYAPQAEQKGLHFDLDSDTRLGSVNTSRLYLQELLQNFITNAIKYTKEGSITLEARRHKEEIEFIVRDTGIGISKSDQVKIFRKFYRAEDYRTRETSGTGLGLYVSAKLARKLKTTIDVSSRLNHGSSFKFSLPIEKSDKR